MGVRLTTTEKKTALFDSAVGEAFGPIFEDEDEGTAFLAFLVEHGIDDARSLSRDELFNWFKGFAITRVEGN